jgi:two-component system, NtrC family, sensor kinase
MSTPKEKIILVVDDEPLNTKMVAALLTREGYRVLEAQSGTEALLKAKENPDLILLDIMMPVLDGIETCRLLKNKETIKDIPVIFLSALQDFKTKVIGFNLGGVDYINKPFHREELLARVKTHLIIREQELRLREYADRLETMVDERTAQLVHADRLATLGTLVAAVAHEMNNPLQIILGNAQLSLLELDDLKKGLSAPARETDRLAVGSLTDRLEDNLLGLNLGALKLNEIIKMMKDFGKKETGQLEPFPLIQPIREALAIMNTKLKTSTTTDVQVPGDLIIQGNRQQFSQIFINLIHNSIDALAGKEGKITISAESRQTGKIIIDIRDSGLGIPESAMHSIFEPFFTTKGHQDGTGLGLFITRQIIEKHGGSIQAVNQGEQGQDEQGAWFRIILPEFIQPAKSAGSAPP